MKQKFILKINFFIIFYIFLCTKFIVSQLLENLDFSYKNQGYDWQQQCQIGQYQSPINIIQGLNTKDDDVSFLEINYNFQNDFSNSLEKIFYDGKQLRLRSKIGEIIFNHQDGTKEFYQAEQIIFKFPSEHMITLFGQTPRYPLEMQIVHRLSRTTNEKTTNNQIQIKNAILSILFQEGSDLPGGDQFLSKLGINDNNKDLFGKYKIAQKGKYIEGIQIIGDKKTGFDINALNYLKAIINYNHHIYRYYGSQTIPPCEENVQWFIFAQPRSISTQQIEFLKDQIVKEEINDIQKKQIKIGNNRGIQIYDDGLKDKIFSMKQGIAYIKGIYEPKN